MDTDNTKINLMNLAISLFAAKGYDGVGVQEICNSAEITKPTLYYHFKSKAGILQEIANIKGMEFVETIKSACEYKHDFYQSLKTILMAVIKYAKENQEFFRLHCSLTAAPEGSEAKLIYQQVIALMEETFLEFFKASTNEFGNMKDKESLYSLLYLNNCMSVANQILLETLQEDDRTVHLVVHSFMYGVAA